MKLPVKQPEWGEEHTVVLKALGNAVANISKVHYYDVKRKTRVE